MSKGMEKFRNYLWLQMKRAGKSLPSVLFFSVLLLGIGALLVQMIRTMNESAADKRKVQIGLVGDLSDPYLELGMYALENLDAAHFTVEFLPMSEEEAVRELEAGRLTAYARIPEGLVESIMWGENKKVTYVTSGGSAEMVSVLIQELMEAVSTLLTESQNSVYGMQRFMENHGLDGRLQEATDEINLRYFALILNRTELYDLEIIGMANQLSLTGYYVCSMLLLFLMLWGITCSPLFVKRDFAFHRLLKARGLGVWAQVLGEYLAYLMLMLAGFFAIAVILLAGIRSTGFIIPEWEGLYWQEQLAFFEKAIPVAALLSAFQLLLFELVSGIVNGVLLQFLCAICLGYLSGCFYPLSFLPEGIRRTAAFLPSGLSLNYFDQCMLGQNGELMRLLPGIAVSLCLFLGMTVLIRSRKVAGS